MALTNSIDREAARNNLAAWLSRKIEGGKDFEIGELDIPQASGLSALTIIFTAKWNEAGKIVERRLVARAQPKTGGVFENCDLNQEFGLLDALSRHSKVPVPRPIAIETDDDSVLGMPFLIMDFAAGRVARDDPPYTVSGWVTELSADERATMARNALRAMAELHQVNYTAAGLDWLATVPMGAPAVLDKLPGWKRYFHWAAAGENFPLIEKAFDWLSENAPEESDPVISWGDSRIGNMIIDERLDVAAIIDWEMVGLGSRDIDLGWWIFTRRFHSEAIAVKLPRGFPSEPEIFDQYFEITGHRPKNIDYYITFAGLRLSIALIRIAKMMIAEGLLPVDAPMAVNNPAANLLADCIGVERPSGKMEDFVGNREKRDAP